MTYKGKTITKHHKGNWYVRVQFNNKVVCLYGKTQLHVYERLKIIAEDIDKKRLAQIISGLQARSVAEAPNIITGVEVGSRQEYTLKQWFDVWLESYKVGNVRASTIYGFKKQFKS